jgi:hypothetical protein
MQAKFYVVFFCQIKILTIKYIINFIVKPISIVCVNCFCKFGLGLLFYLHFILLHDFVIHGWFLGCEGFNLGVSFWVCTMNLWFCWTFAKSGKLWWGHWNWCQIFNWKFCLIVIMLAMMLKKTTCKNIWASGCEKRLE